MRLWSETFTGCPNSADQCFLLLICYLLFAFPTVASDSTGVKRIHKDVGPLKLPPSAFTASSVYKNQPDYQAHKANLVVFASQEQTSGAWCPARPVQNQLNEWLQVEFDDLKMMRVLFTEGRGNSQNSYVPAFLLRYQRQEGHRWYDYRMRNGTKLLYANHNSQTIAITLDPPIVARRFRLYPYNELEPRFMCLRIAVYGTPFEDGVIEYAIPEGSVYRMDPRHPVSLNDTDYDGSWTELATATESPRTSGDGAAERKAYFYGGLGLLMDKNYYDGQLPENGDSHNVVGWFRRQHTTPSDRTVLLFTFDQVRNFSRLLIHALNSLDYVAVFRRVSVQFSLGGDYYDRLSEPVVLDVARDVHNRQARWIRVPLGHRLGRFVRVTLWFDYDWIVLSEISFESTVAPADALPAELATDPARRPTDLDLEDSATVSGSWLLPRAATVNNTRGHDFPSEPERNRLSATASRLQLVPGTKSEAIGDADPKLDRDTAPDSSGRNGMNHVQYLIAVLCCCLGSIVLVTLLVFVVYRSRQNRRRRLKKLKNAAIADTKQQQQQQQLLLSNAQHNLFTANNNNNNNNTADILLPDSHFQTMLPNSFQYNQLKSAQPNGQFPQGTVLKNNSMDGGAFTVLNSPDSGFSVSLLAPRTPGSLTYPHPAADTITTLAYNHFAPSELDHDGLLAMQLMQHGSNMNTNFSAHGASATLSRRGGPDVVPCFAAYPFSSIHANGMVNFSHSPSGLVTTTHTGAGKLNFCPPPPPNQPLPPLPPPSTSPDSASLLQSFTDGSLVIPGTVSHVNPYAASCPMNANATPDVNMLLPFDGSSMPEYASASLFSGNGSNQPTSWNTSFAGSVNVKAACAIDPETGKYKNISDTYCVPHQNSLMHQPYNLWSTNQALFQPPHGRSHTNAFATMQRAVSDAQTGSLDSSGMYYLAGGGGDGSQAEPNGLIVHDCYNPPQSTIFFPFPVGARPNPGLVSAAGTDQFSHDCQKPMDGTHDTADPNLLVNPFVDKYRGVSGNSRSSHSCAAVNGTDAGDSETESSPEAPVWPSACRNHSPPRLGSS